MPEFHFMESDWGTHAHRGGMICTAAALLCTVLSFVFGSIAGGFVAMLVGLVLATFETPFVYKCLEPCRRLEDVLNEKLKFSMPAVRAAVDACLAVICFIAPSDINILLGILLLLTAILYVFAQIVGATLTDSSSVPSGDAAPAAGQTPFGTFT